MKKSEIKSAIYEHREFAAFIEDMNDHFAAWQGKSAKKLKKLDANCKPKKIIAELSEGLLAHYKGKPLIDPYDVYQHLMDYWAETMQDDCYLIAADGWIAETSRIIEKNKKTGKEKDKGWTCDLVPKGLIVDAYFAEDQEAIDQLEAEFDSLSAKLDELEEEHGGEEGAFADLDKINKACVTAQLKEIKGDKDAKEEVAALKAWLKLKGQEADVKKRLKDAEAALDEAAHDKYPELSEKEVKSLVVDDKWMTTLDEAIHGEMDRVSQELTRRVKELAERYETPLPTMTNRVAELQVKVNRHLETMGFVWK